LFEYLEGNHAFEVPGMRDELCYRRMTNLDIYESLRNKSARWIIDRPGWEPGWFLFGQRMIFAGRETRKTEEELNFERLQARGAFCTPGVNRQFRDTRINRRWGDPKPTPSDFQVWREILCVSEDFDDTSHCWIDVNGMICFGDEARPNARYDPLLQAWVWADGSDVLTPD
ncbi:hypothetical protein MMC28_011245, partial [Mycoblastus sanguinarius]|nr:hypothetical protein [Mycoblastus sanguinarius]